MKTDSAAIKGRIREVMRYATDGNAAAFARSLGWKPQYLHKLISTGAGVGLAPVAAILATYPEVDARWLLFGTGGMLSDTTAALREGLFLLASAERGDAGVPRAEACTRMARAAERLRRHFSAARGEGKTANKLHRVHTPPATD